MKFSCIRRGGKSELSLIQLTPKLAHNAVDAVTFTKITCSRHYYKNGHLVIFSILSKGKVRKLCGNFRKFGHFCSHFRSHFRIFLSHLFNLFRKNLSGNPVTFILKLCILEKSYSHLHQRFFTIKNNHHSSKSRLYTVYKYHLFPYIQPQLPDSSIYHYHKKDSTVHHYTIIDGS